MVAPIDGANALGYPTKPIRIIVVKSTPSRLERRLNQRAIERIQL
jgi:hypothetical protein